MRGKICTSLNILDICYVSWLFCGWKIIDFVEKNLINFKVRTRGKVLLNQKILHNFFDVTEASLTSIMQ